MVPAAPADPLDLLADAGLARRDGALVSGTVPLEAIAAAVGTPAFVYNADVIRARYRRLAAALAPLPHRICYAVKANGTLAVLRVLRDLGAGADIVSGGELERVLAAGYAPAHVVFSGVAKSGAELARALEAGVGRVNVESREELERLAALASRHGRRVRVALRVNPDVTTDTHPYISTGRRGDKFGLPLDQVEAAADVARAHPSLELAGLAMHIGSQILEVEPFATAVERLLGLAHEVRRRGADTLRTLDIGGGLGVRYASGPELEPEEYADAIVPLLRGSGFEVEVEPGRYLVGPAGVLLTRVEYRKHSGGKEFVLVDAGMNDLLRPSLYRAHHELVAVRETGRGAVTADVVGPVCESGDFLARDRALPDVAAGDLLAVLGAGAYGAVMGSNYNARPRPPEVIVEDGRWWVARPREAIRDLFRSERLTPDA